MIPSMNSSIIHGTECCLIMTWMNGLAQNESVGSWPTNMCLVIIVSGLPPPIGELTPKYIYSIMLDINSTKNGKAND